MSSVCFYFQVHQPLRLKKYSIFDVGKDMDYFSSEPGRNWHNEQVFRKVSHECYLKTNELLLDLLERYNEVKFSFSLSGIFIEQAEKFYPEVLESFKQVIIHPRVELLAETYHHSLSCLYSKKEFKHQIKLHQKKVEEIFGQKPKIFRNTELVYNNEIAEIISDMGFQAIITEGAPQLLDWRSPNFIYQNHNSNLDLLVKNFQLSDDIAFRFSNEDWSSHPLTAEKFSSWVDEATIDGDLVNLFMDYETFGEHQWADSGIFDFLEDLPNKLLAEDINFVTPSEACEKNTPKDNLSVEEYISWADENRDLSAWRENELQQQALEEIYSLEGKVNQLEDEDLIETWRRLQTSDHFYYMCTKWFEDGDVHAYFNPYDSPYDAFIVYMNVLHDFKDRVNAQL